METAAAIHVTPRPTWPAEIAPSTAAIQEASEPLHEWVVYNPGLIRSDAKWTHLALIIALYSAFILYGVATCVALSYIAAFSLPLTALALVCAYVFLEKVFVPYVADPLIIKMYPYADAHSEAEAIFSRMEKINDASVCLKLSALGIEPTTSESAQVRANPLLFKPLLARYEYAESELQAAQRRVEIDRSSVFMPALENDAVRQFELGTWKLHQALALHVLQHPTCSTTLDSLISHDWKQLQHATHAKLWHEEDSPLAKERPIWTALRGQTYTYKQLLDTPVPELIQAFFQHR